MSRAESFARLIVDGESIELVLDPETLASFRRALKLAQGTRRRDLDRVVRAELTRHPEASLDELCDVAKRRRSEVVAARKRAREAETSGGDPSSRASAVPCSGNGRSSTAETS